MSHCEIAPSKLGRNHHHIGNGMKMGQGGFNI